MNNPDSETFTLIHSYTRAQAIADGVLVDVTAAAREAGLTVPVALTAAVHAQFVKMPRPDPFQTEDARLWDILFMLVIHIVAQRKSGRPAGPELLFEVYVQNDPANEPEPVTLKGHSGPGDAGEHVLTILLPDED